ncbi:MAG: hypothetical protein HYZ57_15315 [Acidobacteria bacterium]|nr:hypothetical protein [Acidobacteriota bacterium]MBI3281203.1 hypothetical protein [Acidobacteriota bacterium]
MADRDMGGPSPDHTRWVHPKYPFFLPVTEVEGKSKRRVRKLAPERFLRVVRGPTP